MLETLRERLLSVQQDFTSGLKTLSDKSREAKVKSKPRTVSYLPKYSAGLELLSRYEDTWAALHKRAKECARAGELVDSEVVMLSAHWEKKKTSLIELQEQLQQLPGLIADVESMTTNLTHLEASFEEVENHLLNLEDLCAQCELERYKHAQSQQLENYKKNKRKELETFKAELDAEHSQKVLEMEHTQQMKLKERQKFFEEAFQQDMEQYLSTGYLQIAERREPMGSMSSMEVNIDMLEQMDLMDVSDQEALDVFLNSGGEDNAMLSPVLGPESSIGQNEISLQVPNPSELQAKPPSLSSTCTDPATQDPSEGGESPVVQSDEEGVEADTALATLHTDDSDS
ncbi:dysbindin isoform X1 [Pteropus alecto]|uniref:Dysbindin isoform X1 n=2 Tax=Pteropus vampyrus TaxID=132908 RepID=A0A6P3QJ56_PTEVA|nr:dysbindin isoform X1 [Pteropus alecto]XP_011361175.1 dysbindin isoform X1 [Pteropus vampyrus]XP_039713898.1 dysbindin isoform X1 [Pteropus giganteus]